MCRYRSGQYYFVLSTADCIHCPLRQPAVAHQILQQRCVVHALHALRNVCTDMLSIGHQKNDLCLSWFYIFKCLMVIVDLYRMIGVLIVNKIFLN